MVLCNNMDMGSYRKMSTCSSTASFRLKTASDTIGNEDTASVYSTCKQKIDSMFETESATATLQRNNHVQDQIDCMFKDVEADLSMDVGTHLFNVKLVGSISLTERITSLHGLQKPLQKLILQKNEQSCDKIVLEINSSGLRWANEQIFGFSAIAVWSAVKFVNKDNKYAFVPLISDPDTEEKKDLFIEITENPSLFALKLNKPLFTVVTRVKTSTSRFECHTFESETSEDAIVTAATLYKALMAHLRQKKRDKVPKTRNGVSCISLASSSFGRGSTIDIVSNAHVIHSDSTTKQLPPPPPPPQRPPRRKTSLTINDADAEEIHTETPIDSLSTKSKPKRKSTKTRQAPKAPSANKTNSLQLKKNVANEINVGDIFTKVTIPRSGSFLNAGGLTRYKSKSRKVNGQGNGGSPLGFSELFNEFRIQEGLESIDEILAAIINTDGMSFNDLKPIYKEFLLKLAVTLTKDELFQRSKAIMRQQKKKVQRKLNCTRSRRIIYHVKGAFRHPYRKRRKKPRTAASRTGLTSESDVSASKKHNRNSSSGYVSFSECSYDSDSCTCVSADKCYCSIASEQRRLQQLQWCKCDTDSCTDSNKCYCQLSNKKLRSKSNLVRSCHMQSSSLSETSSSNCHSPIQKKKARRHLSLDNFVVDYNLFKRHSKSKYTVHNSLQDFNSLTTCRKCDKPPHGFASRKVRNPLFALESKLSTKSFDY